MPELSFETIRLAIEPPLAIVTLDRPDRMNAFTGRMMADLIAAFDATDADDSVRAVIVTGNAAPFAPAPIWAAGPRPSTMRLAGVAPTVRSATTARSTGATRACATAADDSRCASSTR